MPPRDPDGSIDDSTDPSALARPEFRPDPTLSCEGMEALQRELATTATFADAHGIAPEDVAVARVRDRDRLGPDAFRVVDDGAEEVYAVSGTATGSERLVEPDPDVPTVVGVDQAFRPDAAEAVSAAVAVRDGVVVDVGGAVTPLSIPYVPGLLAFREGEPILAALSALSVVPDLLLCDGSGRIHFREAGIATHVGVCHDVPAIGVAKSLLCGKPDESVDERPAGWRTAIRAGEDVETAAAETVIGHAFQSRQYPNSRRVNPLYVSPGHRVATTTAVDFIEALCAGYKLPEPIRLADAAADAVKTVAAER